MQEPGRAKSHVAVVAVLCWFSAGCAHILGVDDLTFDGAESDDDGSSGAGGRGGAPPQGGASGAPSGGSAGSASGATGGTSVATCRGTRGPMPVNIEGLFCIDSTEVSNAHYAEFLDNAPPAPSDDACAWNFNFFPSRGWPAGNQDLPVTSVDYCDAREYCKWAGKRLCGAIGGGSFDYDAYPGNRQSTEMYYACSNGGRLAFPYGNAYQETACATDQDSPDPVGTSPDCVGGFAGVFDLSGNAMEWQDSCLGEGILPGEMQLCRLGSYGYSWSAAGNPPGSDFGCAVAAESFRSHAFVEYGIRCCSDAI